MRPTSVAAVSCHEVSPYVPGTSTTGWGCCGGGLQLEFTTVGGGGFGRELVVEDVAGVVEDVVPVRDDAPLVGL